jgi:hypothetical protein
MGNIPPRSWVILALNEWIGLPAGVSDLDDHAKKDVRDDEMPTQVNVRSKTHAPVRRKPHVIRRPAK